MVVHDAESHGAASLVTLAVGVACWGSFDAAGVDGVAALLFFSPFALGLARSAALPAGADSMQEVTLTPTTTAECCRHPGLLNACYQIVTVLRLVLQPVFIQ